MLSEFGVFVVCMNVVRLSNMFQHVPWSTMMRTYHKKSKRIEYINVRTCLLNGPKHRLRATLQMAFDEIKNYNMNSNNNNNNEKK